MQTASGTSLPRQIISSGISQLSESTQVSHRIPRAHMTLLCNNVYHWLGANLESALQSWWIPRSLLEVDMKCSGSSGMKSHWWCPWSGINERSFSNPASDIIQNSCVLETVNMTVRMMGDLKIYESHITPRITRYEYWRSCDVADSMNLVTDEHLFRLRKWDFLTKRIMIIDSYDHLKPIQYCKLVLL